MQALTWGEARNLYRKSEKATECVKACFKGLLDLLPQDTINALSIANKEIRRVTLLNSDPVHPNQLKAWTDAHFKDCKERELKHADLKRRQLCKKCGCNSHCDEVGDRICFCETCKKDGCKFMLKQTRYHGWR